MHCKYTARWVASYTSPWCHHYIHAIPRRTSRPYDLPDSNPNPSALHTLLTVTSTSTAGTISTSEWVSTFLRRLVKCWCCLGIWRRVYSIPCECWKVNIGQSGLWIETRVKSITDTSVSTILRSPLWLNTAQTRTFVSNYTTPIFWPRSRDAWTESLGKR
jgi:hypothetical protein